MITTIRVSMIVILICDAFISGHLSGSLLFLSLSHLKWQYIQKLCYCAFHLCVFFL